MEGFRPLTIGVGTMLGIILGVGIFGVPYVFVEGGVIWGVVMTLFCGLVILLTHLMFAEVLLHTKERMRFVKMVEIYLGARWRKIAMITDVLGVYGAMLAFLVAAERFAAFLTGGQVSGNAFLMVVIIFGLMTMIAVRGRSVIAHWEVPLTVVMFVGAVVLMMLAIPHVNLNYITTFRPAGAVAPYGVVLFALSGTAGVPTIIDVLKNRKLAVQSISIATLFSILIVIGFGVIVAGISGRATSEDAIAGMLVAIDERQAAAWAVVGLIGVVTGFLVMAVYLRDLFLLDYNVPKAEAWALTLLPTLGIYLYGAWSLVALIGLTGGVLGGAGGALIAACYWRLKKRTKTPLLGVPIPVWAAPLLMVIYSAGVVVEMWFLFS